MPKPRLLDLFSGAGGAAMGYHRASFEVVGVDHKPQKHYPFEFHQADALDFLVEHGREYDAIHASPPCQVHTALKSMWNAKKHLDLIEETRLILIVIGKPYVIENVPGAPLRNPIQLCGTSFGLGVGDAELRRHRLFECSFAIMAPPCRHREQVIGVYGGHARNRRRTIGIYGEGARDSRRKMNKGCPDFTVQDAQEAMGIDWMTIAELSQAIPPAYTEFIGRQLMAYLRRTENA